MMISIAEALAATEAARERGTAERRKEFYSSPAWRALRFRTLKENALSHADKQARCVLCGRTAKESGGPLHVDHIVPRSKDRTRELDPTNVQVFCKDENFGKSNRDATDFRPERKAP